MAANKKFLFLILLLAAVLRLYGLGRGDTMGDEVLYSFRAIGPMDFDVAEFQTTPWEWFDQGSPSNSSGHPGTGVPWWAKISFHDHPPLVFWVQHIFIKILGENNFAFRLPSALLGTASVYLIYLIGERLLSSKAGLMSALLLAVTVNHVFISRIGLQESYVIFFFLLILHWFLKSLTAPHYFIITGVALGLGALTKYTTLIVAPIMLTYLVLFYRKLFLSKYLWGGVALALIIASPIFIYNLMLYKTVGHFDFQFSYIFGQHPQVWQSAPGKEEIGALGDRVGNFIPELINSNSWMLLIILSLTGSLFLSRLILRKVTLSASGVFLIINLVFLTGLMLLIGPTRRFLTILTPIIILTISAYLQNMLSPKKLVNIILGVAIIVAVIVFEIFYSVNSQIFYYPWVGPNSTPPSFRTTEGHSKATLGEAVWLYSKVRYDNYNWGYNELKDFFDVELKNKMPALAFDSKYQFLESQQEEFLKKARQQGFQAYPVLIVYDNLVANIPQLWILDRLQIYHGWPVIKAEDYLALGNKNAFTETYFIRPTASVPFKKLSRLSKAADIIESDLMARGSRPVILKNKRNEDVFRIYSF